MFVSFLHRKKTAKQVQLSQRVSISTLADYFVNVRLIEIEKHNIFFCLVKNVSKVYRHFCDSHFLYLSKNQTR